jgi:hypothetical protein
MNREDRVFNVSVSKLYILRPSALSRQPVGRREESSYLPHRDEVPYWDDRMRSSRQLAARLLKEQMVWAYRQNERALTIKSFRCNYLIRISEPVGSSGRASP